MNKSYQNCLPCITILEDRLSWRIVKFNYCLVFRGIIDGYVALHGILRRENRAVRTTITGDTARSIPATFLVV
jgi:hypothetical protein